MKRGRGRRARSASSSSPPRAGPDANLRAEVDELLGAREEAGSFLRPVAAVSPELEAEFARLKPEEAGERIGHYKLLEQIGQGGFGTVWVAEQERPVRRRVALKIIKLGMDTKEVIARFEQERQALAMMDHPNIAKVFDAGASETGRPYFVMELRPFPSYPSAHATLSGAARTVLTRLFGKDGHTIALSHSALPGMVLNYTGWKQITDDIDDARVYGGIHFQFEQEVGSRQGRDVGNFILDRYLRSAHDDDEIGDEE